MNREEYIKEFRDIAASITSIGTRILNNAEGDITDETRQSATNIVSRYADMRYKLETNPDIQLEDLAKSDYSNILIGILILLKNFQGEINAISAIIKRYNDDLIPKLQQIIAAPDDQFEMAVKKIFN